MQPEVGEADADQCGVDVVHADAVRAARARIPPDDDIAHAAEIGSLLSNPTRLRIVVALAPTAGEQALELCVCDLAAVAGATETHTSHNLRALRLAGVVTQRREGRLVYYRLGPDPVARGMVAAIMLADRRG
ncbi:MAG: metalloregulator ArsR/SmtB family transcription factor [Myxococcota bacterium]